MDKYIGYCMLVNIPYILDCVCTEDQQLLPSQGLKEGKQMPLHNMVPFLSDEELAAEMVVPL